MAVDALLICAAVIFLAGLDKVLNTNFIVFWPKYVSSFVANILLFDVGTFVLVVGIIEIVVAILAVTRYTMLSSYISVVWLLLISINLLMIGGYIDVAIRDLLLAVGAFSTAQLAAALGYTLSGKRI